MIMVKICTIVLYAVGVMQIGVGGLVALLLYMDRVYNPIAILNVLYVQCRLDRVSLSRLEDYLKLPGQSGLLGAGETCGLPRTISVRGAGLEVGERKMLEPCDCEFRSGRVVGISGPGGSGKATLVRLILGLAEPSVGRVLINGVSTTGINLTDCYKYVAYVSQDSPIFDGTIWENLLVPNGMADEVVLSVLGELGLEEFVQSGKLGLGGEVGERGHLWRGRQRLAIAQIRLNQKPVIILGEATSPMGNLSEATVMRGLKKVSLDGKSWLSHIACAHLSYLMRFRSWKVAGCVGCGCSSPVGGATPGLLGAYRAEAIHCGLCGAHAFTIIDVCN